MCSLLELHEFVSMKRYENQKILDYICSMDVLQVPWFVDPERLLFADKRKYISQKRRTLGDVILFILNKLLIPVLRFNFYVTEKHKEGSKIFYFRKPIWKLVSKLTIIKVNQKKITELSLDFIVFPFLTLSHSSSS